MDKRESLPANNSQGCESGATTAGESGQDYSDLINTIATELSDPTMVYVTAIRDCHVLDLSRRGSAESQTPLSPAATIPLSTLQKSIADIWSELLGVKQIGIDDDFLYLGGDSLLAMQIISRVRTRFDVDIPIDLIFERELTIRTLSEYVVLALSNTRPASRGAHDSLD